MVDEYSTDNGLNIIYNYNTVFLQNRALDYVAGIPGWW